MTSNNDDNQRGEIVALYQARLRAEEIEFIAREEHDNLLKKLVDESYEKMNSDYELERSKIDRNAKIQYSVLKNQQRIGILTSQRKIIENAMDVTRKKLIEFKKDSKYKNVLISLIKQGLETIQEKSVKIIVLKEDINLTKECLKSALSEIKFETNVIVDEDEFLSDNAIGGVLIRNESETISVDNSFEARLRLSADGARPLLNNILHE